MVASVIFVASDARHKRSSARKIVILVAWWMMIGSRKIRSWEQEAGGFVFALSVSCYFEAVKRFYEMRWPVILQSVALCLENRRSAVGAAFSAVFQRGWLRASQCHVIAFANRIFLFNVIQVLSATLLPAPCLFYLFLLLSRSRLKVSRSKFLSPDWE